MGSRSPRANDHPRNEHTCPNTASRRRDFERGCFTALWHNPTAKRHCTAWRNRDRNGSSLIFIHSECQGWAVAIHPYAAGCLEEYIRRAKSWPKTCFCLVTTTRLIATSLESSPPREPNPPVAKMQFSAIILALAAVASAASIEPRQTCAAVTAKANACREACDPSAWRCIVNWYVSCLHPPAPLCAHYTNENYTASSPRPRSTSAALASKKLSYRARNRPHAFLGGTSGFLKGHGPRTAKTSPRKGWNLSWYHIGGLW